MKETYELFKNIIRNPGRTVEPLQKRSMRLFFILFIINTILAGALFGYSKFVMDPLSLSFWVVAVVIGLLLMIFMGIFLGIYYAVSKFLLREETPLNNVKTLGYYVLLVYTLYHLVATVLIVILIPLHQYYIAVSFWDISHVIILFWIAALCVQAIQKIRNDEFRTLLKVFSSLFCAYLIQTVLFIIISKQVINLIYR